MMFLCSKKQKVPRLLWSTQELISLLRFVAQTYKCSLVWSKNQIKQLLPSFFFAFFFPVFFFTNITCSQKKNSCFFLSVAFYINLVYRKTVKKGKNFIKPNTLIMYKNENKNFNGFLQTPFLWSQILDCFCFFFVWLLTYSPTSKYI